MNVIITENVGLKGYSMNDMETGCLRSDILALIKQNADITIKEYENWISETGTVNADEKAVFSKLLENFIHLDFTEEEAISHWINIVSNAKNLETKMGRKIGAYTAIVDYFTNEKPVMNSPMLIEIQMFKQTEQLAMVDSLTGLFNRRYMETMLKKEYTRCERYSKDFSVCILDIDDFKHINDTKGHPFGDLVLKNLSALLQDLVREEDVVCRYGGEEFLIIIPETDAEGAVILGNRIRSALKETKFFIENKITFSAGTATFPACARDVETLVNAADSALYQAKFSGKDRVIAATPERRKFGRFSECWSFDICDEKTSIPKTSIMTHNISLGGIQFESKTRYEINANLHMIFTSTKSPCDGVEADGYVTWIRKRRNTWLYGIRFSAVPEDFQTILDLAPKIEAQPAHA